MTCLSLCLTFQAVVWVTPRRRPSSMLEIPCLVWVMWYIARNQVRSGSLVEAKIVPAIGEVCRRHAVHWNRPRVFTTLCSRPSHAGHTNPSGQRDATTVARHCSSVPYCRSNAGSLSPFWNCTALRAISCLPQKIRCVHGLYRTSDG